VAQETAAVLVATPPVVDTIIIVRSNVFTAEEVESSGFFRLMNSIHVTTKEWLIRDYLEFEVGQPYDAAEVDETERKLRAKHLFRALSIDSVRLEDGRLAVRIESQDGWSLKPKFALSIASSGDWTGALGINEINLLGTGNQVYLAYVKEIDRDGLNTTVDFDRLLGSQIDFQLNYASMSDGNNGNWITGVPFRNSGSTQSLEWDGLSANQDVFRYRNELDPDGTVLDTTIYRRDALINNLTGALATRHSPDDYLRFGAVAGVRTAARICGQFRGGDNSHRPDVQLRRRPGQRGCQSNGARVRHRLRIPASYHTGDQLQGTGALASQGEAAGPPEEESTPAAD